MGTGSSNNVPESLVRAVSDLRRLEHVPAAHVDLFEKVALAQWRARRAQGEAKFYPPPSPETASQMLGHGFYLIDFARLALEPAGLKRLWEELCTILAEFGELDESQADKLRRAAAEGKLSLLELGGIIFRGEQDALARLARRLQIGQRPLAWLTTLLLRPYLSAAAEELAGHLKDLIWPHPYCPVCGHEPFMAILLRPNGRREVECSLCATRWNIGRLACPFCGNDDPKSSKFLYYDLESPYRVDLCAKCRRYMKSVDERKMASDRKPLLLAEDIATLYFDVLARRKRYLPPWSLRGGKSSPKPKNEEVVPG
jgi:FdhE protein